MGNYTTPAAVRALSKLLPEFSSTSRMTIDEVTDLIAQHEAEIDVAFAFHGYTTPVTAPANLLAWVRKIAAEGVAAAVLRSLFQDKSGPNSQGSDWEKRYQTALEQIRKGNVVPAVTDESGGAGISSFTTDYYEADALEGAAASAFATDTVF